MTAQRAEPEQGAPPHDVIHLGGESAVVVPTPEYQRIQALISLATPEQLTEADEAADQFAAAQESYREWSEAERPDAMSGAEARRRLFGET